MENKKYLKPAIDGGWWTDEIKITSTEIWACLGHQLVARRHDLDLSWPHHQRCNVIFEEKDMEKILLTILICFDNLFICARSFGIPLSPTSLSWIWCRFNVISMSFPLLDASLRFADSGAATSCPSQIPVRATRSCAKMAQETTAGLDAFQKFGQETNAQTCGKSWKYICTMALWFVSIVSFLWCFSMIKSHDRHVFTSTSLLFSKHLSA